MGRPSNFLHNEAELVQDGWMGFDAENQSLQHPAYVSAAAPTGSGSVALSSGAPRARGHLWVFSRLTCSSPTSTMELRRRGLDAADSLSQRRGALLPTYPTDPSRDPPAVRGRDHQSAPSPPWMVKKAYPQPIQSEHIPHDT